jgi:AAA15 family ATPase/GTPase
MLCWRDESMGRPTRLSLEILIEDVVYEFTFAVNEREIVEERLVRINGSSERELYHRDADGIHFDGALDKEPYLHYAFKGTRPNQLFLTNAVSKNDSTFSAIYNWFKDSLILIAPDSTFGPIEQLFDDQTILHGFVNSMLRELDTGITHLGGEEFSADLSGMPKHIREEIQQKATETVAIKLTDGTDTIQYSKIGGRVVANKLVSFHAKNDGDDAKFEISQESDGSRRIIELLPAFLSVTAPKSKKVIVIDEFDRSLHTLLTRKLLERYLDKCSNETRAQLLFTTHDVLLMDQRIFRRDEMWVTERDRFGVSTLLRSTNLRIFAMTKISAKVT